jgi:hypothetical protein
MDTQNNIFQLNGIEQIDLYDCNRTEPFIYRHDKPCFTKERPKSLIEEYGMPIFFFLKIIEFK